MWLDGAYAQLETLHIREEEWINSWRRKSGTLLERTNSSEENIVKFFKTYDKSEI
jgi:hypothetical protein